MPGPTSSDDGWSTPSYRTADAPNSGAVPATEWSTPTRTHVSQDDRPPPPRRVGRAFTDSPAGRTAALPEVQDDGWSRGGPVSAREQRATRQADRQSVAAQRRAEAESRRTQRSVDALSERARPAEPTPYERGMAWWWALAALVAITLAGAVVDHVVSTSNQDGFNLAIVIASIVGILLVKRSQMFPIVVSPPIVYAAASLLQLYLKKSLSQDKHGALNAVINAVQNYLVYGFPALATATAAVLIIAGIRLVAHR